MAAVHIKNTFFSSQNQALISPIPATLGPKTSNSGAQDPLKSKGPELKDSDSSLRLNPLEKANHEGASNSLNEDLVIQVTKVNPKKIENLSPISDQQNKFQKTYQKFALLEFNKNVRKQFVLDLKDMPKNFLSLGFTVDHGSIQQPKVEVKYTNGSTETLKLPFSEMFQDDWVKLDTNPDLKIESINVSALSPVDKSVFSFFIQEHL